MKHFIIVKFDGNVNFKSILEPIKSLFNKALNIEGIDDIKIHVSNTDLPNRHDLMIEMILTKEALKEFDNSKVHQMWKNEYGKYIVNKIIFDCD